MRRLWLLFLLFGCAPNSSSDFRHEGEARCRSLVLELQKIENREQLLRAESQLKRRFESLVALMIEAREFKRHHPDEDLLSEEEASKGEALEEELRRIYTIEGGREVIERAQAEALIQLDTYERSLKKQRF